MSVHRSRTVWKTFPRRRHEPEFPSLMLYLRGPGRFPAGMYSIGDGCIYVTRYRCLVGLIRDVRAESVGFRICEGGTKKGCGPGKASRVDKIVGKQKFQYCFPHRQQSDPSAPPNRSLSPHS